MKKIYLLVFALLIAHTSQSQSWPFVGAAGQGLNAQYGVYAADILAVSDKEVYTALFQTDISAGDKSLKVYQYDGASWKMISTLSTDVVIGKVYFRKSKTGTIFIAYSKISPQSNYNIYVKKLTAGNFVSVGDSLPLTSGISYFGFDIDNNDNPIVLGSKSFVLDPTRVSKNVNGVWSHTTVPNGAGVTIEENNTLVDDQNNLIFMYVKTAFVNGALASVVNIDTMFSNNTITTGTENISNKFTTFFNMLHDANNNITILNREGAGSSSYVKTFTFRSGKWNESATDTVPFVLTGNLAMSASGKIVAASLDGKVSVGPKFNTIITQPSTNTICYKITCNGEKGYAIYGTGIVSGELNTSIGINKSSTIALSVYPNPTSNTLYFNTSKTIASINVYSQDGRLLMQETTSESLSLEALQNGLYFVEAIFENGEIGRAKVMKQ